MHRRLSSTNLHNRQHSFNSRPHHHLSSNNLQLRCNSSALGRILLPRVCHRLLHSRWLRTLRERTPSGNRNSLISPQAWAGNIRLKEHLGGLTSTTCRLSRSFPDLARTVASAKKDDRSDQRAGLIHASIMVDGILADPEMTAWRYVCKRESVYPLLAGARALLILSSPYLFSDAGQMQHSSRRAPNKAVRGQSAGRKRTCSKISFPSKSALAKQAPYRQLHPPHLPCPERHLRQLPSEPWGCHRGAAHRVT